MADDYMPWIACQDVYGSGFSHYVNGTEDALKEAELAFRMGLAVAAMGALDYCNRTALTVDLDCTICGGLGIVAANEIAPGETMRFGAPVRTVTRRELCLCVLPNFVDVPRLVRSAQ